MDERTTAVPGHDRIEIDPRRCHGRPVIRGTRVPVAVVVGSLGAGMTMDEVAAEYDVSLADQLAALRFATELLESERYLPLAG